MGKYCIRSCFVGLTMLVCVINIYAQPPDTTWTKTFGANEYAGAYSVQQTSDWGYIIVGSIRYLNEDYGDIWLIKTDPLGDSLWARTYGGDKGESASSVHQTPDKGYIIGGYTNSFGAGLYDAWLIKTDSLGNVRWAKTYGGSNDDLVFSIEQTSDNGYVMAGSTQSFGNGGYDMLLIKTDSLGNFLWMKTYGGPDDDGCASVKQTEDNGYILAGATFSFGAGENDCYLVKTDSLGDTLWTRTYGGERNDCAYAVQQAFDHGFIATGYTFSYSDPCGNLYLIRIDMNGDTLWTREWGGLNTDIGYSLTQGRDSTYVIAGLYYDEFVNFGDIWLLKVDTMGDTIWTARYGFYGYDEWGWSVQMTGDYCYIIAGEQSSASDVYLVKTTADPGIHAIKEDHNAYLPLADLKIYPNPFRDRTDIKYQPAPLPHPQVDEGTRKTRPGMTNNSSIEMKIYDATGRLVRQWDYPTVRQSNQITWDGRNDSDKKLPSGVYFLKFETGDYIVTKKLILLR